MAGCTCGAALEALVEILRKRGDLTQREHDRVLGLLHPKPPTPKPNPNLGTSEFGDLVNAAARDLPSVHGRTLEQDRAAGDDHKVPIVVVARALGYGKPTDFAIFQRLILGAQRDGDVKLARWDLDIAGRPEIQESETTDRGFFGGATYHLVRIDT